jgi:hypothetical protein
MLHIYGTSLAGPIEDRENIIFSEESGPERNETSAEDPMNGEPDPIPLPPQPISNAVITGDDYQTYVLPLFTRWWKFRISKTIPLRHGLKWRYPQLSKAFRFRDNDAVLDFIRDCTPFLEDYEGEKKSKDEVNSGSMLFLNFYLTLDFGIHQFVSSHNRPSVFMVSTWNLNCPPKNPLNCYVKSAKCNDPELLFATFYSQFGWKSYLWRNMFLVGVVSQLLAYRARRNSSFRGPRHCKT